MDTLDINVSRNVKQNPQYPDGYYLCKDKSGFYVAMMREGKWSFMHADRRTIPGHIARETYESAGVVMTEIIARLNFIDT